MNYYKDNINHYEEIIYSCQNNEAMMNQLNYFPTLYLEIKEYNLTFLFNYKELFKLYNERFYFLIYFNKNNNNREWEMGEIFLRKYITSFNNATQKISFYRNQIEEINKITNISYSEKEQDEPAKIQKSSSSTSIGLAILWIVIGIIIFAIFILVFCCCCATFCPCLVNSI